MILLFETQMKIYVEKHPNNVDPKILLWGELLVELGLFVMNSQMVKKSNVRKQLENQSSLKKRPIIQRCLCPGKKLTAPAR